MNVISLYVPINCLHHGTDGRQTPWEFNSSNFILSDSLSRGKICQIHCLGSLIKHQHNSWFPQTQEAITFQLCAPWVAKLCQWTSRFKTDYVKLILSYNDSPFILTLNRPGFLESSTAGGADSAPLCNFLIWRPMTMKFGDVILRQKLYQEIIKHLMTSLLWRFYDVILYFKLRSAKKSRKS